MKKLYKLLILLVLPITVFANAEHHNYFCAGQTSPNFVNTIAFTLNSSDSYSITNGQTWGGIQSTPLPQNEQNCINIEASRHDSTQVQTWVEGQLNALGISSINSTTATFSNGDSKFTKLPNELNFAVEGTLDLVLTGVEYICSNVIISQSGQLDNAWLIYNNNSASGPNQLSCQKQVGANVAPVPTTIYVKPGCLSNDSKLQYCDMYNSSQGNDTMLFSLNP